MKKQLRSNPERVPTLLLHSMSPFQPMLQRLQLLFLALFLFCCAGQVPPQGGLVDTTPPEIISTYPRNYSTGFSDNKIVIEFDEYVDRRSVEGAIFISPFVGTMEFDWSGKEVEVRFSERLRQNTTYVVNIGTDVVDVRNRNRMAQSFTLAFSTGEEMDRGVLQGKVFPMKSADPPSGLMVFAYKLDGLNPDTLNPRTMMPDYVTQTGKAGEFLLRHVALAPYRLMAVRDEFRNLLYDPETDEYGVPSIPIRLTPEDTIATNILMQLAREDTTAPRLIRVAAANVREVSVEFSEAIDTATIFTNGFHIVDTLTTKPLRVLAVSPNLTKPSELLLSTDPQQANLGHRLKVEGVKDLSGLSISPLANSLAFSSSDVPDTASLRISSVSLRDSARGTSFLPQLQVMFSKPVRNIDTSRILSLEDASKIPIASFTRWIGNSAVEIRPQKQLAPKAWYVLRIAADQLQDFSDNAAKDSSGRVSFETMDSEFFSSIEGILADKAISDTSGGFVLLAHNVSQKDSKPYTLFLPNQGSFKFTDILEGRYALRVFRDRNGDRTYTSGLPFPFQLSERFAVYPDTLKLRARWPLEGVKMELR